MSSSQQSSNNSNNNNSSNQNQYVDYEPDESLNSQQQISNHLNDNRNQSYENDLYQQMYPFQEDIDEDLPNEIVAELDARDQIQSNIDDEDESVYSDVVQDAFKKYQNEYSKYWTYNDTQEELYAQMEECWNYITQEENPSNQPQYSIDQSQSSKLNPDAIEFKPSWLKSSEELPVTLPTSQLEEQENKI